MFSPFQLDFWHFPKDENDTLHVHVHVCPEEMPQVLNELHQINARVKVYIEDIQKYESVSVLWKKQKRSHD